MGKREEQNAKRRQQILQIALDEFTAKGYYGTSTREISKIAGISSGLMFHYFDSKEKLYEALVEIGVNGLNLVYTESDRPIEIFEKILVKILKTVAESSFAAKMFLFMQNAHYFAAHISPHAGELLAQFDTIPKTVPLIERGQFLGEIRDGYPLALSVAFWCSVQGIAEELALYPNTPCPNTDWILDILRSRNI